MVPHTSAPHSMSLYATANGDDFTRSALLRGPFGTRGMRRRSKPPVDEEYSLDKAREQGILRRYAWLGAG